MKKMYYPTLHGMYQNLSSKLEEVSKIQHEGHRLLPNQSEHLEKLKRCVAAIKCMMQILDLQKGNIPAGLEGKLPEYEKKIISTVSTPWKKPPLHPQGQLQQDSHGSASSSLQQGAHGSASCSLQRGAHSSSTDVQNANLMKPGLLNTYSQEAQRKAFHQHKSMPRYSSLQMVQQALPSNEKDKTTTQYATPPFVSPSPSTPSAVVASPLLGDCEKPPLGNSSSIYVGNVVQQQSVLGKVKVQTTPPGNVVDLPLNVPTIESPSAEQPIERLIKAIKSASPAALKSAASGFRSVVRMVDRIGTSPPMSAPFGSINSVGKDLPSDVPSASTVSESCKRSLMLDTSELESITTPDSKRLKVEEENHALLDEIRDINRKLIETVVDVVDDYTGDVSVGEGTVVKFTYIGGSFDMKSQTQESDYLLPIILPLHLLIPTKYPKSPPIVLDKIPAGETSSGKEGESNDLSAKAISRFMLSLRDLPPNMCLKDMARAWDLSTHEVVLRYAEQNGGGSFSTIYGSWKILNS